MASIEYAVEIGAWIESDTPKATGKGFRKVWVAGDAGEESRLSVIARTDGKPERHLVTLHVGDADARDIAAHVLGLALQGVQAYGEHASKPAKAAAPKPAPKAPTPPKAAPTAAQSVATPVATVGTPAGTPAVAVSPSRVVHADVCKCAECEAKRSKIETAIATARAAKPAPAPRVASPAPKPAKPSANGSAYDPTDWAALLG